MTIRRSGSRVAAGRMSSIARELLGASDLAAIATVSTGRGAYISTAYVAWGLDLSAVWLSHPDATHSANIKANPSVAIAVYDSTQRWEQPDRGIQLFGRARQLSDRAARRAAESYVGRFPESAEGIEAYCWYLFRPRRVKLFDESEFGPGVFVTAGVGRAGTLVWRRTEVYGDPVAGRRGGPG